MNEIINGLDAHSDNQKVFGLPSRLIAKVFLFRLIYGGSAYSYANDPDFTEVSRSERFWQRAIDAFYEKYYGWKKFHTRILSEAITTGKVIYPTGRTFQYEATPDFRGGMKWPRTTILNYGVQGVSADFMSVARVIVMHEWRKQNINGVLISSVHDSIVADVHKDEVDRVCHLFISSFHKVPKQIEKIFGVEYPLPFNGEVQIGSNLKDMVEWKPT